MSIIWFIICWVLVLIFIIGITLILFYSKRIDQCRTWKVLYCRADQQGWRCTNLDTSNPTTTLADNIANVQDKTKLVPCPSNQDTPASGSTPAVYASYVLAPDPTGVCDTTKPDNLLPDGCKSTGVLGVLRNFPSDPLVVPSNGLVTGQTVFDWFCNANLPANTDTSNKRTAWKNFLALNPDFQLSTPVTFIGQQGA
jgi:hypothetical protein